MTAGGAQRERAYSKRLKLTGSRGHVTVGAQNRRKLNHLRPFQSLVAAGNAERERPRYIHCIQQATEAYWLTRARDSRCAEPFKSQPPSSVSVTYDCGWSRERDRDTYIAYSKRLKITGSQGHVPVDAQNRLNLSHRCPFQSLMTAGEAGRETEIHTLHTASDWRLLAHKGTWQ
jgi:hypothetical protein